MSLTTMQLEIAEHVVHLKLNRPEALNTMVVEFWQDMVDAFAEIAERPEVRVVVISSTGRHFTAGLDLSAFGGVLATDGKTDQGRIRQQLRQTVLEMQESFNAIERCRVPVIAAIQGGCIGGGVDLISACDIRFCTANAWFCIHEVNIGMTADVGTLQRLPHLIPAGVVREMAYSGRRLPADRALSAGLVNEVYEDQDSMLDAVMELATEIASKSPLAVHGTKEMLLFTRDHSVADGLNHIATWNAAMILTDDLGEAIAAQQQKREPEFADLLPRRKIVRRRD